MNTRERLVQALPAVLVSVLLHVFAGWWLLRTVEPWHAETRAQRSAAAMEVFYFDPDPPPPPAVVEMDVMRVYAVPFPMSERSVVAAEDEARAPASTPPDTAATTTVDSSRFFNDIAGVAGTMQSSDPQARRNSDTRLRDDDRPFFDTEMRLKPPPPSPQKIAQYVGRLLVSTTGANPINGLMGAIPGRDPGREIQGAHHNQLYLPRGCDDPDNPNLSDECMGIEKR